MAWIGDVGSTWIDWTRNRVSFSNLNYTLCWLLTIVGVESDIVEGDTISNPLGIDGRVFLDIGIEIKWSDTFCFRIPTSESKVVSLRSINIIDNLTEISFAGDNFRSTLIVQGISDRVLFEPFGINGGIFHDFTSRKIKWNRAGRICKPATEIITISSRIIWSRRIGFDHNRLTFDFWSAIVSEIERNSELFITDFNLERSVLSFIGNADHLLTFTGHIWS